MQPAPFAPCGPLPRDPAFTPPAARCTGSESAAHRKGGLGVSARIHQQTDDRVVAVGRRLVQRRGPAVAPGVHVGVGLEEDLNHLLVTHRSRNVQDGCPVLREGGGGGGWGPWGTDGRGGKRAASWCEQ